ncbi:MAG: hypothetical protein M1527_01990 [Gammaproteobacteria bacterium]|nr:hypothetical protein [Gammaproteobacteria bacterium]
MDMDFLDLLFDAEILDLTGVNRSTLSRWRRGLSRIPRAAARLLTLYATGDAEALLGRAWRGWRFGRDGLLYHPCWRRGFTSGELAGLFWRCQQVAGLEREVERLTAERDRWERIAWQVSPAQAIMARVNTNKGTDDEKLEDDAGRGAGRKRRSVG